LQDYPGAASWAFLDKLICLWRIEEDKVRSKCGLPAATPYGRCQLFRNQAPTPEWLAEQAGLIHPIEAPRQPYWNFSEDLFNPIAVPVSASIVPNSVPVVSPPVPVASVPIPVRVLSARPTSSPATKVPVAALVTDAPVNEIPFIQCDAWDINFPRMCSSTEACCGDVRADTNYCLDIYDKLGTGLEAACFRCCDPPQPVGPAAPVLDDLPLTIQCSALGNVPNRMCRLDSCCSNPRSQSDYCNDQYSSFSKNELKQICHYCCSTPSEIGPSISNRNLRSSVNKIGQDETTTRNLVGSKEFNVLGKKFLLGKENFLPTKESDQENNSRRYSERKRRNLQQAHLENYDDVEWHAYEWLFRVETEYYFRYEGTMSVPPCWEVVHWRNMKDPLIVNKRQIDELNRLLAWRNNPTTCARETAGVVSQDGIHITAAREIQYKHDQHRFVFCECPNWPSKFKKDRNWCHKYKEDTNYTRFYNHPYSFQRADGPWLPQQ
jgi:Eukaryotic-type carbonic anhydrase